MAQIPRFVGYLEGNARRNAFALLALAFSLLGFVVTGANSHAETHFGTGLDRAVTSALDQGHRPELVNELACLAVLHRANEDASQSRSQLL